MSAPSLSVGAVFYVIAPSLSIRTCGNIGPPFSSVGTLVYVHMSAPSLSVGAVYYVIAPSLSIRTCGNIGPPFSSVGTLV